MMAERKAAVINNLLKQLLNRMNDILIPFFKYENSLHLHLPTA